MFSPSWGTTLRCRFVLRRLLTMTSPWSPLPNLSIATVAISLSSVAAAADAIDPGRAVVLLPAGDGWFGLGSWLGDSYHTAPALMLVLVAVIALPTLGVAGFMLRRQKQSPDVTV